MKSLAFIILFSALQTLVLSGPAPRRSLQAGIKIVKPVFPPLSQDLVDYVNNIQTTWKASPSERFKSLSDVRKVVGVLKDPNNFRLPTKMEYFSAFQVPQSFDARDKWQACPYINEVRDQSNCGSCWAFGAVQAITDRYCIHSNGAQTPRISAEDLVSCCGEACGNGCHGGYPHEAWQYWVTNGIVTGGEYGANLGCQDYAFPKCSHHVASQYPNCSGVAPTPQCKHTCQPNYPKSYEEDKHYGQQAYSIANDEQAIMVEIMTNGPVEASFTVYEDFANYRSGVYQHVTGEEVGGHAVKMIGWGVENDTPYWLLVNSWNQSWGDQGFFKMKRGTNECEIEDNIVAGLPRL